MKLVYKVNEKPTLRDWIISAFQQLLAILAATIAVPSIIGNGMSQSAALFGAGVGTIVYLLFTKFKSPVFLGSSFAFIGSMFAAFAGGVSMSVGYLGLLLGAAVGGVTEIACRLIAKHVFGHTDEEDEPTNANKNDSNKQTQELNKQPEQKEVKNA